jgi:hypothetical protein
MGLTTEEDIGQMAAANGKGPIFEWAIGWLAREGKGGNNP